MENFNNIVSQLYKNQELNDCIGKVIPTAYRDDFKQELFLILLEKNPTEIVRISESGKLLYYVVRIILNLSRQERNIFHTKYMDKRIDYDTEKVLYSTRNPAEVDTMEERQQRENQEDNFLTELSCIDEKLGNKNYPYYQSIVELIAKYGSMREVSRQTGIPKTTVARAAQRVRNHFNDNLR